MRFLQSNEGSVPLPDQSVDVVFSTNVFEHVMHLEGAFGKVARVLRPGGD